MTFALDDMRADRRRLRAEHLTSAALKKIAPYIEEGQERYVYYLLRELFTTEGIEILTDKDRHEAGLPPRDAKGWSQAEIVALEEARLASMRRPTTFERKPK